MGSYRIKFMSEAGAVGASKGLNEITDLNEYLAARGHPQPAKR